MHQALERLLRKLGGEGLLAVAARGSAGAFLVRGTGLAASLGAHLALTRLLGAESYGVYTYVFSWLLVLGIPLRLGQDAAALRFVAAYRATAAWGLLRGFLRRGFGLALALSLPGAAILATVALLWRERLGDELARGLLAGSLLLPLSSLLALGENSLQALRRTIRSQLPGRIMLNLLIAGLLAAAALLTPLAVDGPLALWCSLIAHSATLALILHWLRQALPAGLDSAAPEYRTRQWIAAGLGMSAVAGQFLLLNRIDILMLGSFAGNREVGIYGVATRLAWLVTFLLDAAGIIGAPLIAELHARGDRRGLQRLVRLLTDAGSLFGALVLGLLLVLGGPILGLFGPEFPAGWAALAIMAGSQLLNALTGPSGYLLTMTGHERALGLLLAFCLPINALLNWLLIPRYGMAGAAAATAIVLALLNLATVVLVRRKLGIWSLPGLLR